MFLSLKLLITDHMQLKILEAEEKSRKIAMEGQLALAALFINAIKQHSEYQPNVHFNQSMDFTREIPNMLAPNRIASTKGA